MAQVTRSPIVRRVIGAFCIHGRGGGMLRETCQGRNVNFAHEIGLLATFGDVESVGTSTREIKKLPLSHGAVFMALSWTGTRGKISKPPRFTKCGQEP